MLPDKRRKEILRLNKEKQGISIKELAEFFKVSNMTILRDVKLLQKQGKIENVRGGIIPVESDLMSLESVASIYNKKRQKSLSLKQQIAKYCAQTLVKEGDLVTVEGGSTASSIVKFLENKQRITLVTNGLFVVKEASELLDHSCRIQCSGGLLDRSYFMFLGPDVDKFFDSKRVDVAFISCVGFDLQIGTMDSNPLNTQAKLAMFKNATKRVLLVDKSKFDIKSGFDGVPIDKVTDIVTNASIDPEVVTKLEKNFPHVKVHLA